jgi:radical SAM/Cys-rich protein
MLAVLPRLIPGDFPPIRRGRLETLQVNLGYLCNQQCRHCHVNAGPKRKEIMTSAVVDAVIEFLGKSRVGTLDLTGGAPELNPYFRQLVSNARALGCHVIDRCNLTVLEEAGQDQLATFLAEKGVEVVASLPCYLEENVDAQRGNGVYETSIRALRRLNELGYGQHGSGLTLTLVYNPQGGFLPPDQRLLEEEYRRELRDRHGVVFDRLYALVNMPIARFGSTLLSTGGFDAYLELLKSSMRTENLAAVMCRSLISVDWQGYLYDCDFNQMLGLSMAVNGHGPVHLSELLDTTIEGNPITVADHCYGCTAGHGSSCGGALRSRPEADGG